MVVNVTVFSCDPGLPFESKDTFIGAEAPGFIGSFGGSGTVQPQLPLASEMIKSVSPTFLTINSVQQHHLH